MRSSWPIVIGVAAVGAAAFWWDAHNEVAEHVAAQVRAPFAVHADAESVAEGSVGAVKGKKAASTDVPPTAR